METPRPKSVPSSPMVKRAFSRLGTITAGWGRSIRKQNTNQLNVDDKKKWSSTHDCSSKFPTAIFNPRRLCIIKRHFYLQTKTAKTGTRTSPPVNCRCHGCPCARTPKRWTE